MGDHWGIEALFEQRHNRRRIRSARQEGTLPSKFRVLDLLNLMRVKVAIASAPLVIHVCVTH
jgi:hypothetical protein